MIRKRKSQSIFQRIFVPILLLMILQAGMFYTATIYGGVMESLNQNADAILAERVINRENELENLLNTKWTDMELYSAQIGMVYEEYSKKSKFFYDDSEIQKDFLNDVTETMIAMLRANEVNGVFLILNDKEELEDKGGDVEKYGLCIRDYDVNSSYTDKEDLLVVRCPVSSIAKTGCSLETWWEAVYTFHASAESDYYYKPLEAAYNNPGVENDNLAYFCGPHRFAKTDKKVVSYSIPLLDKEGYPYAVLGVELTTDYLASLLPSEELYGQNVGSYALVQYRDGTEDYTVVAADGVLFQRCFGNRSQITMNQINDIHSFTAGQMNELEICKSAKEFKVYNRNTPFESEKLALVALVEKSVLYKFSYYVKRILLTVTVLMLMLGIIGILLVSHHFAAPIKSLAKKVRNTVPEQGFHLEKLYIYEIDQLIISLQELSKKISEGQARTEFFSRMSHDMRTPMNAIIGFSSPEMLADADEETKGEYLEKIHSSGQYLLGLINEVLDMTKIESGKMELHESVITMQQILKEILPIVDEVAKQKGVHFSVKVKETEDYAILTDRRRLEQIFVNLLSNAVKFTEQGGTVTLKIKAEEYTKESVYYQISIKDNGIGMSEGFIKQLYTPFVQENTGMEGTGLGLSISKKLVELMGGSIDCTSKQGEGTEFIVRIVLKTVEKDSAEQMERQRIAAAEQKMELVDEKLEGKRVLLCEDNKLNAQIAGSLLTRKKICVDWKQDGAKGLEAFSSSEEGYYDAVLMDIRMPVMNGLETARAIRSLTRGDAKTVPIIAMTANAFEEDRIASREAGMDAHLAKPIEPIRLFVTLSILTDKEKTQKAENKK